jgi:hypothetical protein
MGKRLSAITAMIVLLAILAGCSSGGNGIADIHVDIGPSLQPTDNLENFPRSYFQPRELVIKKKGSDNALKNFELGDPGSTSFTPGFYQRIFGLPSGTYIAEVALIGTDASDDTRQEFEIKPEDLAGRNFGNAWTLMFRHDEI